MTQNLFVVCVLSLLLDIAFTASATAQLTTTADILGKAGVNTDTAPSPSRRLALVVGNGDYPNQPLRTPKQDARSVTGLLATMGFEIITLDNASAQQIRRALDELNTGLGKDGIGLFYFAGHGMQLPHSRVLLPIDAKTASPLSVRQSSIGIGEIVEKMSAGRPHQPNLIIVDACLNNPFGASASDGEYQLTQESWHDQTLIAFSAPSGGPAFEGTGSNSIYTAELIGVMSEAGLTANEIFTRVRLAVSHKTGDRQIPWMVSSLQKPFYFTGPAAAATTPQRPKQTPLPETVMLSMLSRGILPQDGEAQYELEFWQSIKDSTDAADYEAYLEAYPNGKFAPLARSRAQRYKKPAPVQAKQPQQAKQAELIITDMNVDYVVLRTANIRQEPSANSKRLGELKQGSKVQVTGQVSGSNWYQVKSATGVMGFVFGDLLMKPAAKPKAPASPPPSSEPKPLAAPTAEPKPAAMPTTHKSGVVRDCPSCPEMILLPAGTFTMGDNGGDRSERPAHKVSIKRPFAIGKYEVTTGQWNECVKAGACSYKAAKAGSDENSAVRDVSWKDAQEYVRWLSQITNQEYRLPTEAEWEYSARANTTSRFWWGSKLGNGNANCKDCGGEWDRKAPANVDAYPANPFGVYGTSGGVWEWVSDCWHKSYKGAPKDGSSWDKPDCRENVIRGGSWRNDASYIHSASRFKYDANVRYLLNGFRVAKTLR
jgi:formylglycine-generating enzyme required for sulfatase activity